MPKPLEISLADENATRALGASLAELLPSRFAIGIDGTLGAGKTRFTQGLASALGIDPETVLSPTYTLVHEYPFERHCSTQTLYHLDAYRVRDADEFWELGVEELFERKAWVVIEWAERVAVCLPDDHLRIELLVESPTLRRALITAQGPRADDVLAQLAVRYP
ncbi:MAG: tRNA (adenosine(37)-N6)-threonylcarbamoyltransferase complex ATPase subunit type 1 TsaE [Pirellulales bacterium]